MTRDAAIKKLKAILGARLYWRVGDHVTSPERRARHTARVLEAEFAKAALVRDRDARREAILAADGEYQQLRADAQAAHAALERARWHDRDGGYRFEVGTRDAIFTKPLAYGDTWEEIFSKLSAVERKDRAS